MNSSHLCRPAGRGERAASELSEQAEHTLSSMTGQQVLGVDGGQASDDGGGLVLTCSVERHESRVHSVLREFMDHDVPLM